MLEQRRVGPLLLASDMAAVPDGIYLDINATTPLEPVVLEEITKTSKEAWGNPSSCHATGLKAKNVIEKARLSVAKMIGAKSSEIIFTSGGTESNNMVLHSALHYFWEVYYPKMNKCIGHTTALSSQELPHFIVSNIEHDSITKVLEMFVKEGKATVSFVPVSKLTGKVDVTDIIAAVRPSTIMVTLMTANNETGIIQPVAEACEKLKQFNRNAEETPHVLFHTDAAQSLGKTEVDVEELGVDFLTIVGHKFYGPRIGALYKRDLDGSTTLFPMMYGGGQERKYRPGTENTAMIAGLGKAAELVSENISTYKQTMSDVRDYLEEQLMATFGNKVNFNGRFPGSTRLPNTCNVSLIGKGLEGWKLLANVKKLQASVGSACLEQKRASPILLSIGIPEEVAKNALRLSVGRHTTRQDINLVIDDLVHAVLVLGQQELD